jgi:hypothetical protein
MELISHLFFHKERIKFVGLSYDGFYEVDEHLATGRLLQKLGEPRGMRDRRHGHGLSSPQSALARSHREHIIEW